MQKSITPRNHSPVIQSLRDEVLTIATYTRIGQEIGRSTYLQGKKGIDLVGPVGGASCAIMEMARLTGIKMEDAEVIAVTMAKAAIAAFDEEEAKGAAA
ncbi:hypothetical protein AA11826_2245 [Komagataeibacter oboediens DSM 11826]|uniref:hypothetical protein n=1 Tax=Komagataeibacter TaxID=1434011 RepID=UPI0011B38DD2|nr:MULTISPECIES: hypothetical protein [Komagataeibacter]GBQ07571.1 hypothetical protein AA11826_2245 [Komagataeibacter oboediens DSM 11826]